MLGKNGKKKLCFSYSGQHCYCCIAATPGSYWLYFRYNLEVDYITDPDFKKGLEGYIASTGIAAIVLGTRRYGCLCHYQGFNTVLLLVSIKNRTLLGFLSNSSLQKVGMLHHILHACFTLPY
jgi:hypothetical protein